MDLRIQKTYRALITSFTQLLETHRYEDVTVAMLCDAAMIRRTTFYKHFADKSAFFAFFIDSLRDELLKHGEQCSDAEANAVAGTEGTRRVLDERGRAILQGLVEFMLKHERLVDNIFESSMSGIMMLMMVDKVAETLRIQYRKAFVERWGNGGELDAATEFAAGGVVRLLERWWMTGHSKEGEDQLVALATDMVARVLSL